MKKIIAVEMLLLLFMGCASMEQHNGRQSILMNEVSVELQPLQADIKVGHPINGVAECEKWFGLITKKPQKQTYGANLQVPQGNFTESACTRGAVYEALTKNNADVIITPRYTAVKKKNWCIFGLCFHVIDQIIVTGYKGEITNLRPMDKEIIKNRRLNAQQESQKTKRKSNILGLF